MTRTSALPLAALAIALSSPAAAQMAIAETGTLSEGDDTSVFGAYADQYVIEATEGQTLEVSLASEDFDAYLTVRGPNGEMFENDDAGADTLDSRIMRRLPTTGAYTIEVSSYWEGETGNYALNAATSAALPSQVVVDASGELTAESQQLPDGKYFALHPFSAQAGQQVTIELTSDDFDTLAVLVSAAGAPITEDDDGGEGTNSRIQMLLEEGGSFMVAVTSFEAGTTGTYQVTVTLD